MYTYISDILEPERYKMSTSSTSSGTKQAQCIETKNNVGEKLTVMVQLLQLSKPHTRRNRRRGRRNRRLIFERKVKFLVERTSQLEMTIRQKREQLAQVIQIYQMKVKMAAEQNGASA